MSSDQEAFRKAAVELRIMEGTAEMLQSRISIVDAAIAEHTLAKKTLEGVKEEKKDAQLFVPVGAGSYVKAKLESVDTVLVGIGAGVSVEKTIEAARETVEDRLSELENSRKRLEQQLVNVAEKIQGNQAELEEITKRLNERRERKSSVRKVEGGA
jgi:prefoldin alpha subunit